MKNRRRNYFDHDNPHFKRLHPMLLDIFSTGMIEADRKKLVIASILAIIGIPYSVILAIVFNLINLVILGVSLLILWSHLMALQPLATVLVYTALLAIFYRDIKQILLELSINSLAIISGGRFFGWLGAGFLKVNLIPSTILHSRYMEAVIVYMMACAPSENSTKFDNAVELYTRAHDEKTKLEFDAMVSEYWRSRTIDDSGASFESK